MPTINDLLSKLQRVIYGTTQYVDLKRINDIIQSVRNRLPTSFSHYIDNVLAIERGTMDLQEFIQLEAERMQPEYSRIARYREYKHMSRRVTYIRRALRVITDNIVNPDDYTKTVFSFVSALLSEQDKQKIWKIITESGLDRKIYGLIYNTLLLGDQFIEIMDESVIRTIGKIQLDEIEKMELDGVPSFGVLTEHLKQNGLILESHIASAQENAKTGRYRLIVHHPGAVTIIGSKDVVLGYLVFPDVLVDPNRLYGGAYGVTSTGQLTLGPVQGYSNLALQSQQVALGHGQILQNIQSRELVADLARKLLKKITSTLNVPPEAREMLNNEDTLKQSSPAVADLLLNLLQIIMTYPGLCTELNKVRFVPVSKMVHFKLTMNNESEFEPYGTSMLYGLEYIVRTLIALETAIVLYRLTRSVDRRVFHVETGVSRDVQTPIQRIIRTLSRRRYAVHDLSVGLDEIPSQISSFEDLFIPMKAGKRFIEVDTLPAGNLNVSMDDWKELRDALLAGLLVPPAYLGEEQSYETRGTLAQENVVFATLILNLQREFAQYFEELIHKVFRIRYKSVLPTDFKVIFNPPMKLLLERYAEMSTNFSGLAEVAKSVAQIDPRVLFEKFFGELIPEEKQKRIETVKRRILGLDTEEG